MVDYLPAGDYISLPVGTAGTLTGLLLGLKEKGRKEKVLAYPVLKDSDYLIEQSKSWLRELSGEERLFDRVLWRNDYHFGGYGKASKELIEFKDFLLKSQQIIVCSVYGAKHLFGLKEDFQKGFISTGSKIVALHTGGIYPSTT